MNAVLQRIVVACVEVDAMADFYRAVLDTPFERVDAGPFHLYNGDLGGVGICLLPAGVAGIEADENRHQLTITVDALEPVIDQATAHGGSLLDDITERGDTRSCSVRDPDGNSLEFVEGS